MVLSNISTSESSQYSVLSNKANEDMSNCKFINYFKQLFQQTYLTAYIKYSGHHLNANVQKFVNFTFFMEDLLLYGLLIVFKQRSNVFPKTCDGFSLINHNS
jgi:short subunit fatty acids transporter